LVLMWACRHIRALREKGNPRRISRGAESLIGVLGSRGDKGEVVFGANRLVAGNYAP
jgi:hypothetical protein